MDFAILASNSKQLNINPPEKLQQERYPKKLQPGEKILGH